MPFQKTTIYPLTSAWNEVSGVYGFVDANGLVIYIGKTNNLKRRYAEHYADAEHLMRNFKVVGLMFENVADDSARNMRERQLIAEYNPPCNQRI